MYYNARTLESGADWSVGSGSRCRLYYSYCRYYTFHSLRSHIYRSQLQRITNPIRHVTIGKLSPDELLHERHELLCNDSLVEAAQVEIESKICKRFIRF